MYLLDRITHPVGGTWLATGEVLPKIHWRKRCRLRVLSAPWHFNQSSSCFSFTLLVLSSRALEHAFATRWLPAPPGMKSPPAGSLY